MATSTRYVQITFSDGVSGTQRIEAASNTDSPASIEIKTLSSGNNTITVPTGGSTVRACTIEPPTGNTVAMILKGANGDTGVALHDTDPTSIAIDGAVTTFVINVDGTLTGLRLLWS